MNDLEQTNTHIDKLVLELQTLSETESEVYPISYELFKDFAVKIDQENFRDFLVKCYEKLDNQFSEVITIYAFSKTVQLHLSDWRTILNQLETPGSIFSVIEVLWKYFGIDSITLFCELNGIPNERKRMAVKHLWLNKIRLTSKYVDNEDIAMIEHQYKVRFDFHSYMNQLIMEGAKILPKDKVARQEIVSYWHTTFFNKEENGR
jgi:hypothetical protein